MAPIVMWTVVALVAAVVVIVIGSVAGGRAGGMRQFLTDLRAGLRRDRDGDEDRAGGFLADARRDLVEAAEVESSSVDEIFTIGEPQQTAYLGTGDIAETLNRAAGRSRGATRR